jgi:excisionase family DNA binding protein
MTGPVEPLTYTVEEAAELVGIGRNKAYEAAKTGEIPTIKIGKRIWCRGQHWSACWARRPGDTERHVRTMSAE